MNPSLEFERIQTSLIHPTDPKEILAKTQRGAVRLADKFASVGVPVGALHSGKSQALRARNLPTSKRIPTRLSLQLMLLLKEFTLMMFPLSSTSMLRPITKNISTAQSVALLPVPASIPNSWMCALTTMNWCPSPAQSSQAEFPTLPPRMRNPASVAVNRVPTPIRDVRVLDKAGFLIQLIVAFI